MSRHLPAHVGGTGTSDLDFPDGGDADRATIADWARLLLNAALRRKSVFLGVFILGMGLATLYYLARTPVYRAETKILAQRQQAFAPVLRSAVPDDVPTRLAAEFILRRDNLLSLLRQTNVLTDAAAKVPAPSTWHRFLEKTGLSSGAVDIDPRDLLVQKLDRSLSVVTGDGTVTITLDWPDPQQAYLLVEAALQNFLEARQLQEIQPIDDAIVLLKGRLAPLRDKLDAAVEAAQRDVPGGSERVSIPSTPPDASGPSSESVGRLQAALEAKRRSILDIETFRQRRLLELQAQLEERRTVYSDAHPLVINLRTEIAALGTTSPQVEALRAEEAKLRAEYSERLAEQGHARGGAPYRGTARLPRTAGPASLEQDERVRDARTQYQQMLDRINAAQLDLDNARAAFRYRYSVVWPAEVPRKPFSPNPWKTFGAGFVGSLLLALLASAAPDVASGRIVERWQVERRLGLPVLASLDGDR